MAMASTSSTTARMLRRAAFSAQSRGYASAASTSTSASASTSSNPATSTSAPPSRARSKINVSLILSRQPILLREPTELESTVHTYNHALQRRLQQPFARDFYFRPGSAGANAFEADEAARRRDIDGGDAAGAAATVKGKRGGGKDAAAAAAPTTTTTSRVESGPAALPRKTKADEENDTLSLERALDRTLFLVYKDAQTGQWRFPTRNVDYQNSETLHRVAPHSVTKTLGEELDIWLVTNMPVGLLPRPGVGDVVVDEKTYFLRGHILSGSPSRTPLDKDVVSEYAWLTSEEIAERLRAGSGADACKTYHEGIVDLLSA